MVAHFGHENKGGPCWTGEHEHMVDTSTGVAYGGHEQRIVHGGHEHRVAHGGYEQRVLDGQHGTSSGFTRARTGTTS